MLLSLALLDVVPASALLGKCCSVNNDRLSEGCRIRLSEGTQRVFWFFEQQRDGMAHAPDGTRGEIQTGSALQ